MAKSKPKNAGITLVGRPIRRGLRKLPVAKQQGKKSKPKRGKRIEVNIGDLVQFKSPVQHMSGIIGTVEHILSKNQVLVRGIAPADEEYKPHLWVCETRRYKTGNHYLDEWTFQLTKVLNRARPLPPKPVVPKRVVSLDTEEDVVAALTGAHEVGKGDVVVVDMGSLDNPDHSLINQDDIPPQPVRLSLLESAKDHEESVSE